MTAGDDEVYLDDEAGSLLRPYTVNEGRTYPTVELDLLSLVVTKGEASPDMDLEHFQVLALCRTPTSIAEVAAHIRLPVIVTKVLVADLLDRGVLAVRTSPTAPGAPDRALLEKLLDGLQRI